MHHQGFVAGPAIGFATGFAGALISDYFSYNQLFLNWELASGFKGVITSVGYYKVKRKNWPKASGILALVGLGVLSATLSVGFALLIDVYQFGQQATPLEFVPPAPTYIINSAVLLPILMSSYGELRPKNKEM